MYPNQQLPQRAAPRGFTGQRPVAPQGAPQGAFAGPQGYPQQQVPGYMTPQGFVPLAPQGADQGNLAGCGPGNGMMGPGQCGPTNNYFAGIPTSASAACFQQPCSLLGIVVTPTTAGTTTLEISCGSTVFYGYCGRSFNDPLTYGLTAITSGQNTLNKLCPDGMVDVAYFNTTECCCPFDFGCFSNAAPLVMSFAPITTLSILPPFDFVIGGNMLQSFGCPPFWCGPGWQGPPNGGGGGGGGGWAFPGGGFAAPGLPGGSAVP